MLPAWWLSVSAWLAGALVLGLPGALWVLLTPADDRSGLERTADALGLSAALTALGGLIAFYAGWYLPPALSANLEALLLVALILVLAVRLIFRRRAGQPLEWALGAALLLALILWRFFQARSLAFPAWVDSVHHTLIVRKMAAVGGVPPDLLPEIAAPFYYHFGFHLLTARFVRLSGLPADQAVLWLGQVLNACVSLAVYRLARALRQPRRSAALAALLTALAFQMPAYYLAWGRYTLLTGLLLAPLAMAAACECVGAKRLEPVLRLTVLTAGVCLSHYLAALMLGLFLACLTLFSVLRAGAWPLRWLRLAPLLVGGALGYGLAAPWLWRVWQFGQRYAGVQVVTENGSYSQYILRTAGPWRNHVLLALGAVGLLLALRRPALRPVAAWGLVMALLALPWGLRLDPFRPDHWVIVLFLPAALLAAALLHRAALAGRWVGRVAGVLAVGGLLLWGGLETADLMNDSTLLADQADRSALQWVMVNTPPEARFLINTRLWQAGSYRGVDGGYWLLPFAGRQTVLPPAVYGYGDAAYRKQINDWALRASRLTGCTDELYQFAKTADFGYIYIHEGVGALQPEGLRGCPGLYLEYHRSGVWIYSLPR